MNKGKVGDLGNLLNPFKKNLGPNQQEGTQLAGFQLGYKFLL